MKHICLQENDYDCGLACIKMMLVHYHKNKEFFNLDKEKINARYSLLELKRYAEKYNLFTEGVEFSNLEGIFDYQNSLIQVNYNDLSHFVIYERKTKSHVYLIDPQIGKIKVKIDDFYSIFTGKALIFKEFKEFKLEKKKKEIKQFKWMILYICFLMLDFSLLLIISNLGNDNKYLFHNFLVIFALILLLISKNNVIRNHLKSIDNNIIKILKSNQKLSNKTKQGLLKYKVMIVKYNYGLINCIFIILFLLYILFVNGWYNILICFVIAIISFVFSKLKTVKNNTLISEITKLEYKFYKDSEVETYQNLIKKSDIFSNSQTFSVVVNQFIVICLGTILNNVLQVNSFQYILFNSFYYLVLISKFNYLFKDNVLNRLEFNKYSSSYNYLLKKSENKEANV